MNLVISGTIAESLHSNLRPENQNLEVSGRRLLQENEILHSDRRHTLIDGIPGSAICCQQQCSSSNCDARRMIGVVEPGVGKRILDFLSLAA